MVALTFDDGPNDTATPHVLERLAGRGVVATFFVLGAHAEDHPHLISRMLQAGHGVQPHCWDWESHGRHRELSRAELEEDLARTVDVIASLGAPAPVLWRPPNGDIS